LALILLGLSETVLVLDHRCLSWQTDQRAFLQGAYGQVVRTSGELQDFFGVTDFELNATIYLKS
jgi:hypothetical protein